MAGLWFETRYIGDPNSRLVWLMHGRLVFKWHFNSEQKSEKLASRMTNFRSGIQMASEYMQLQYAKVSDQ